MSEHGGQLLAAARKYRIGASEWLDLSTGISPFSWPLADIDPEKLQQGFAHLPQADDGLEQAARCFYGARHVLPVAGSQAAIKILPLLYDKAADVAVISPSYCEHASAWEDAGYNVTLFSGDELETAVAHNNVVVLVNPNNPTGERFDLRQLLDMHKILAARGGWLIVDEAFMDVTPEQSLIPHVSDGLLVLRSLGKFFGLAGARVGFVFAAPQLLAAIADEQGPWTLAGPSRLVAIQALRDECFQRRQRKRLRRLGKRLETLLARHGLKPHGHTALFSYVINHRAADVHRQLAQRAILTRLFDDPPALRLGLPGEDHQWQRLDHALAELKILKKEAI